MFYVVYVCRLVAPILLFILGSDLLFFANSEAVTRPAYRLPEDVVPRHYDLEINTGLNDDDFKFWGSVLIKISCLEDTDKIVVHSRNLTIGEKSVTVSEELNAENLKKLKVVEHSYDHENEYYIAQVEPKLEAGKNYSYFIPFQGIMPSDLAGFYRSSYKDRRTNTTKWLGVTQFESTDARKAFPCFDEPKMKATFTITIGHPDKFTSISNMPLEETVPVPNKAGWVHDKYKESVPMSTYLVAWVVSDFVHHESTQTDSGVQFRVWAREDAINQTKFASDFGPKVLSYYEEFFSTEYPLPKQDMIAIPDFSAGAMENWGLITYRHMVPFFYLRKPPNQISEWNQVPLGSPQIRQVRLKISERNQVLAAPFTEYSTQPAIANQPNFKLKISHLKRCLFHKRLL